MLQGIPNVAVYIDDPLVTGKTDQEHLSTLKQVFENLQENVQMCLYLSVSGIPWTHCQCERHATPD